jgi:hypothetical protein
LNEHSRDAVECEDESDTARVESKPASELERRLEVRILRRVILHGVVHEDRYELIERDVMKSKESIYDQVDDSLIVEYFTKAGWRKRWLCWRRIDTGLFVRTRGRCELWFEKRLSFFNALIIGTTERSLDPPDCLLCVIG